ncbi:MAG: type II toxin-antitoxin system VapC family toxin [Geminicoccaceae bacterium]
MRKILESEPAAVAVAATTVWEIAIKTARGKLPDIRTGGHATLAGMLRAHGFDLLPLDAATAEQAGGLPAFHADPFDRALVAIAQRSGRTVLTSDAGIAQYGVPVAW